MRVLSILAGLIFLVTSAMAQLNYEVPCPLGSSPMGPNGATYNPTTHQLRANTCVDAFGHVTSPLVATGNINAILYVDGIQYPTVQSAINALPTTGGTVMVPVSATNYVGPTSIPSNTALICLGPYVNPASFGGVSGTGNGCHFTFSASLTLSGVNNLTFQGIVFDFTPAAGTGLILNNFQWGKFYDMRIDCITSAVCLTLQSNAVGSANSTQFNNFIDMLINCNTSQCLLLNGNPGGSGGWATNNHFGTLILNGAGTVGDCGGNLIEFKQQDDTNVFDYIFINITANSGNGFCFNGTATPTVNADADAEKINAVVLNVPLSWTGKAGIINASSGNEIHIAGGNFPLQWSFGAPSSTSVRICGSGQITSPTTANECDFFQRLFVGVPGNSAASGAVIGDMTIGSSATGGKLFLGSDGVSNVTRAGTDLQLNIGGGANADILPNVPIRGPLFQPSTGSAVTAAIGAGWGTGATMVAAIPNATLQETNASRWLITSGSAAYAASPTFTLTFNTPFLFSQIPNCSATTSHITGAGGAVNWNLTLLNSTTATFTAETSTGAAFTPAITEGYTVSVVCL